MAKQFIRTNKAIWDKKDKSQYKDSIVFIEDVKLIWSNDIYYGSQNNDNNIILYVTYDDLCEMVDHDELIPGMKYKIDDYEAVSSQYGTEAPNEHPFHIIVTALDERTLDENAIGIERYNDNIFELKYSLDPLPLKFEWMRNLVYPFKSGLFALTVDYIEMDDSDNIFSEDDSYISIEESDISFSIPSSSIDVTIEEKGESIFFYDTSGKPHNMSYVGMEYVDYYSEVCYCFEYSFLDSYLWMYVPIKEYTNIINPVDSHRGVVYYMKDKFGNVGYFDYYNITNPKGNYIYDYIYNSLNDISWYSNNTVYNYISELGILYIPSVSIEASSVISNCIFKSGLWGDFLIELFTNNKIFGVRSDGNIVSYCLEDIIAP